MKALALAVGLAASLALPARADPAFLINDGGSVGIDLSRGNAGLGYAFLGLDVLFPIEGAFSLVPGAVLEVSPRHGNWGLVGSVSANYRLNGWFAVEMQAAVGHDQDPVSGASGFFGLGPSAVFIMPRGFAIGPALLLTRPFNVSTWSLSPTLNFYFLIH